MSQQKLHISKIPFGQKKLTKAKVMVYQLHSTFLKTEKDWSDWQEKAGLFYPKNISKFREKIFEALEKAEENEVNLIVFPELSVPEQLVEEITEWSAGKNLIVVAGSHYKPVEEGKKPIAKSPVIFNGVVKGYSQKVQASFPEKSAVPHSGLQSGSQVNIYTQTPIGDFAILICSENLDEHDKVKLELKRHKLDFWIVPAFQTKSKEHFDRLTVDVRGGNSRYIIYCNNKNQEADGKSSFFGQTDKKFLSEFVSNDFTDNKPEWKLISLNDVTDFFILNVDIDNKRPHYGHSVNDDPNVEVVIFGSLHEPKIAKPKINSSQTVAPASKEEVQVKKVEANPIVEQVENHFENTGFTINSKSAYENALMKFESLSAKPNGFKGNEFINPKLIEDIRKSLNEKGIAFITAPIRFGKSFMLNYAQLEFADYSFISKVEGLKLRAKQKGITTLHKLYYFWFQKIAESILNKMGMVATDIPKESAEYIDKIEDEDRFKEWIKTKRPSGESDIQGFIRALAEFKTELNFNKDILIAFHLDDIHEYTNSDVFQHLRNDLVKLKNDFNAGVKLSVKVLVASRYIPAASLKNITVNILPHFETNQIISLTSLLNEELTETNQQRLAYSILEKTDGYPWFVIRFFKIYLTNRKQGSALPPLALAEHIFSDKSFWLMDTIFGNNNDSEFIKELTMLIGDSDYRMKESFKQFIESDSGQIELNNGYYNENDFLIRQSGFLKLDYLSDSFLNNGSYIMKNYYQDYIQQYLQ